MIAAAIYLNIVFCTSPSHTTCMPPTFYGTSSEGFPVARRVEMCKNVEKFLNNRDAETSHYYQCSSVKGNK